MARRWWGALLVCGLAQAAAGCDPADWQAGDGSAAEEVAGAGADSDAQSLWGSAEPYDWMALERVPTRGLDSARVEAAFASAERLPRLRCLLVARHGEIVRERCFRGPGPAEYANMKSVSKSILSALVGIAINEGHLQALDQPVYPFFRQHLAMDEDPRKRRITIEHLLSMRSGLERTSGGNYAEWVSSRNWVRDAITRPMVAEPGGPMIYSTGNTHLLSAIVTRATGESTWEYAREKLAEPLGVRLPRWTTDPQGVYFGGNEMRLSPRAMIRLGELYRNGGVHEGRQVVPAAWVRESLTPRARSPWSGEAYGLGWFMGRAGDHPMFYAWGYGGQFIFVIPSLELTVATTSDPNAPREREHLQQIRELVSSRIVPAAEIGARTVAGAEAGSATQGAPSRS